VQKRGCVDGSHKLIIQANDIVHRIERGSNEKRGITCWRARYPERRPASSEERYSTMPTIDKLIQGTKGLKVKEIPNYVGKFAAENWTPSQTSSRLTNWFHGYKAKVRQ
jgi:hypothetical protein